jgi:HEPN domain-containing protein
MSSPVRPPLWGNFVAYADNDLLAFGLLIRGGLMPLGFYHGIQAIEKYLKALVLSILDPAGTRETPQTQRWLRTHDLEKLATECGETYAFYSEPNVAANLRRFTEFDQATRYPWVNRNLGNGFSGEDISVIAELCKRLRNDLPITIDNYKLGMEVRGYFHGDRSKRDHTCDYYSHEAVSALRSIVPSISDFVRGWDTL